VTEEIVLRAARHVQRQTGSRNLVLAGGVALNCVANGRVQREGPFEKIWIQPAAGDAGGALGVAQFIHYQLLDHPRRPAPRDDQQGSLLGPRFGRDAIEQFLRKAEARYVEMPDEEALCDEVARLLAEEKVVGWFSGRMEFGPRGLGARSILGDARSASMQLVLNLKIKFRESFRPFAPAVLEERAGEYFEMRPGQDSPYMLLVAPVRREKRVNVDAESARLEGIERLKVPRSVVPATTHVDDSARVQTVDAERHGRFYKLLQAFERLTGSPVLINTSFNVRGEPIVCTPQDAYRCFLGTNMDVLVLEDFVLKKDEQAPVEQAAAESYLAQFQLD
jgi:carbamoyltransferase